MSRTFNHKSNKSSWKASCKKVTNRSIRHSKLLEPSGCSEDIIFRMENEIIKNMPHLTSDQARELFDWVDLHTQEEISVIPQVTKFRFWMD